jgi:hypothetical protein
MSKLLRGTAPPAVLSLCAALLLGLAAALLPPGPTAAAEKTRQFTPPGWPLALTLSAQGTLEVKGQKGAKDDDLQGDDFLWYNDFYDSIPGAIYSIDGAQEDLDPSGPGADPWQDLADAYMADLQSDASAKATLTDANATFSGRRWLRFDVQRTAPDDGSTVSYVSFATLKGGKVYYVDINYNAPAEDDLDGQLAIILGGPNAAQ